MRTNDDLTKPVSVSSIPTRVGQFYSRHEQIELDMSLAEKFFFEKSDAIWNVPRLSIRTIHDLPMPVMEKILSYLPIHEQASVLLVCKHWYSIVARDWCLQLRISSRRQIQSFLRIYPYNNWSPSVYLTSSDFPSSKKRFLSSWWHILMKNRSVCRKRMKFLCQMTRASSGTLFRVMKDVKCTNISHRVANLTWMLKWLQPEIFKYHCTRTQNLCYSCNYNEVLTIAMDLLNKTNPYEQTLFIAKTINLYLSSDDFFLRLYSLYFINSPEIKYIHIHLQYIRLDKEDAFRLASFIAENFFTDQYITIYIHTCFGEIFQHYLFL